MKQVPLLGEFSQSDSTCVVPAGMWSTPLLEVLAKCKVTVFTSEQEVIDLLSGKTSVYFAPPELIKSKSNSKKKKNPRYIYGFLCNWGNPFEESPVRHLEKFLKELPPESVLIANSTAEKEVIDCSVLLPIQSKPMLTSGMLQALYQNIPVFLPEESKSFFPEDLPIRFYTEENWKILVDEALADLSYLADKKWAKAYSAKAVKAFRAQQTKSTSNTSGSNPHEVSAQDWARLLLLQRDLKKAQGAFSKAKSELDGIGKNDLAVCLAGLGKLEEAKELFMDSGIRTASFNIAQILLQEKKAEEAFPHLRKFVDSSEALEGVVLWPQPNAEGVRFLKFPQDAPERDGVLKARALHDVASVHWEADRRSDALQALKEAAALDPSNPYILFRLALLNIQRGMVAQPIKMLNETLKLYPFFFDAAYLLGCFYSQVELYEQAAAVAEKYLKFPDKMNTMHSKMLNLLSYLHYQQGNPDKALEIMQTSLKEDPEQPELPGQLSVIYLKKAVTAFEAGLLDEATRFTEQSLAHDPKQSYTVNLQGSIAYKRGAYDEAAQHFKAALELDPELTTASTNLEATEAAKEIMVSLIVLSHNEASSAASSLASIIGFSDLPYELIYLRPNEPPQFDFLKDIPKIRLVKGEFSGMAQAYNHGANLARGKYMVFMEDDVTVTQNWLSRLIAELEQDDVGFVGPVTNFCGNPDQIASVVGKDAFEAEALDGFCMVTKRDVLMKIGAFDEAFKVRGLEDRDLSLRAKLAGYKLLVHAGVFVSHIGLMPVFDMEKKIEEVDNENREVFRQKWEDFKSKLAVV